MSEIPGNTQLNQGDIVSIREILSVLLDQKTFILIFCLSAILTALALSYIASEKYESATTISFRPQEVIRLKAQESQAFGAPLPAPPFEMISQNLEELVRSENILRAVVIELNLDKEVKAPPGAPWYVRIYRATKNFALELSSDIWMLLKHGRLIDEDPVSAATKALRKNITFIDKGAYIFYIIVRDKYPRRAPMIVDSIASHLVEYLHNEQKTPGIAKKGQLKKLLDEKLAEIQSFKTELESLLTQNTIVSSSLEAEQSMARWSKLEIDRIQVEGEIEKIESRLADTEKIYASKRKQTSGNTSNEKPLFIHPDDYKKLSSERLFAKIELNGLHAKQKSINTEIASLERVLKKLPAIQSRIDYLETRLDISKRDFLQITDAYQEALVRSTASLSEAEILHPATIPTIPVAPIKVYNVGLAALLSLFISIALVYLLTYAEIYLLFPPNILSGNKNSKPGSNQYTGPDRRSSRQDRRTNVEPISFTDRRKNQSAS